MKHDAPSAGPHRLPPKTFWTVVWFVLIGGGALVVDHYLGADDATAESHASEAEPDGPLPLATAPPQYEEELRELERVLLLGTESGEPRLPHQPIEDDPSAGMCHFYDALRALHSGTIERVRVLHYGDSILTTDEVSGTARRILQRRFGDGGHGFVLLGRPWRWYRHIDVRHGARGEWRPRPLTSAPVRDGLFGLGGVAFETRVGGARAWVAPAEEGPVGTAVASYEISYLRQPHGGRFEVLIDGEIAATVETEADEKSVEHRVFEVPSGNERLLVRTLGGGPVRLFGAVLETDEDGVVWDSLAINGARASVLDRFDKEHWQDEIRLRDPALVILMFGANEGANEWLVLSEYREHLMEVLETVRDAAPRASCLVVGPLDQASRKEAGGLGSKKMPSKLSSAQREVTLDAGCGFFDTYTAMGGENSMARWFRNGLGGGDLIHPTELGARKIGAWIADALLAGYERFVYEGRPCR